MSAQSHSVQSVVRAMVLLETLADSGAGMRLTDLARRTGLSPSTAHRLLTTLQGRRFVQFDPQRTHWSVGPQAFSVGSSFGQRLTLSTPALPHLRVLRDLTHETANFGIVDGGRIIVMAQVESREIVRAIACTGGKVSLTGSAMGKAVLSTYSREAVDGVLAGSLHPGAFRLRSARLALDDAVNRARVQGYAVEGQESRTGLRCIASPVRDRSGEVIGAISLSGPGARLSDNRLPAIGAQVALAAAAFSKDLGAAR